jgi:putative Mn2+ efflux pump MntP
MMLMVAIAISVDELAIGLSGGLSHVPLLPLIVLIAAQALLAPQAGFMLGARIQRSRQESIERAAGIGLLLLAALLALEQLHVI